MQIELLYAFAIGISITVLIATLLGKLSYPMAIIIFLMCGIGLAYLLAPYISLIMTPLANSIWYGYSWGLFEIIALAHLISTFFVAGVMVWNLSETKGQTGWT